MRPRLRRLGYPARVDNSELSMSSPHHPRLTASAVRARYNRFSEDTDDPWHRHTAAAIRWRLQAWRGELFGDDRRTVLNAGSGGDDLGVCPRSAIHIDLSERRLAESRPAAVGSVECLPLRSSTVDTIICVGSVINYCDPAAAINEFSRVARDDVRLVIEFESSASAELLFRRGFGAAATIVDTFYGAQDEVVWAYRPSYIEGLLHSAQFEIVERVAVHTVSPWVLLASRSLTLSSWVTRLDTRLSRDSRLHRWASNHIWLCRRRR